jgi:hypothetical protein
MCCRSLHRPANSPYLKGFLSAVCPVLHRIAFPVVSEWCQLHSSIHFGKGSLVLVLHPSSQGTQGTYRHARQSPSLHHRMQLQPVVEAPRMCPVSEGSLHGVVAVYGFEEPKRPRGLLVPIEPTASASSSCVSPRSEKVRTHARAQYILRVLSAGASSRASWNAGNIGSEEQVFCDLLRIPSRRDSGGALAAALVALTLRRSGDRLT